jgi:hypothetical protein
MVPPERGRSLNDAYLEVGPHLPQPERGQPASETATDDEKVEIRHARGLAGRKGKVTRAIEVWVPAFAGMTMAFMFARQ